MPSLQASLDDAPPQDAARRRGARAELADHLRAPGSLASAVLLAAPVVAVAVLGWQRRWMSDDGFINVRVVANVFAGHGPVFNVGERVEVGTSTLWLVVLSVGHAVLPFLTISRLAVYGGLLATVLGLVAATAGAAVLWRRLGRKGPFLPLGTIVVAALPPFWDFATSGLETGLAFLWSASSFLLLALRLPPGSVAPSARPPAWRPLWPAVVIGLGPLVRPDLTLLAAVLGLALLAQSRRSAGSWLGGAAAALAVPMAYEVFRAGYYAALVPNTALAKGAGSSMWQNGLHYLDDFAGRYLLALPLLLAAVLVWTPQVVATLRRRDVAACALLAAPVVGGVLHGLFVVRVGGDFMHGRFLLPSTFSVLLPVAAVVLGPRARDRFRVLVPLVVLVPWAVVAAGARPDYQGIGPRGIADERAFYTAYAGEPNPVDVDDYAGDLAPAGAFRDWHQQALIARERAQRGERLFVELGVEYPVADGYGFVVRVANIGIYGVAAGPRVFVADRLSLASAVGSRLELPPNPQGRIGHSQEVPLSWDLARYALPSPSDGRDVRDARAALQCGELARLDEAVTAPMTPRRFLRNLAAAPTLTRLSIPVDPTEARATFCGGA